jgi:hypothetical protein
MPRYPKNGNIPRAKRNGELIHAVVGPFTQSLSGFDHFLAMIEDFSNLCGIVPMVGQKPPLEALKDFDRIQGKVYTYPEHVVELSSIAL